MRAHTAVLVLALVPALAWPQSAATIVNGTVLVADRDGRWITVRDGDGVERRITVVPAIAGSAAKLRAGMTVVLTIRGNSVRSIAAAPPAQEVPQLPPGASAPQNRAIPQLPPGADAPQGRPIPQVPAVSPRPDPRPSVSPRPVSPRPAISPRSVSPRPAVSPVTGPTPKPVVLPSDPPPSPAS